MVNARVTTTLKEYIIENNCIFQRAKGAVPQDSKLLKLYQFQRNIILHEISLFYQEYFFIFPLSYNSNNCSL